MLSKATQNFLKSSKKVKGLLIGKDTSVLLKLELPSLWLIKLKPDGKVGVSGPLIEGVYIFETKKMNHIFNAVEDLPRIEEGDPSEKTLEALERFERIMNPPSGFCGECREPRAHCTCDCPGECGNYVFECTCNKGEQDD